MRPSKTLLALSAVLAASPVLAGEAEQAAKLFECLGEKALDGDHALWFKEGPGGTLHLTAAGKKAVEAAAPGLPCEGGAAALPAPRPPLALTLDPKLMEAAAVPDFDGGTKPGSDAGPLRLALYWGTAPRAEVHARNLDTLYGLAGRGTSALTRLAAPSEPSSAAGIGSRVAKMLAADAPLAYVFMIAGHEGGHFETARQVGGKGLAWREEGTWGQRALGHSYHVGNEDALSPAALQAVRGAGIQATQAAAAELRRIHLGRDRVDWTFLPQWLANKADFTGYMIASPRPSRAPADTGKDTTNYALLYGDRSGRGAASVHRSMVGGAVWNAVDPLNAWALYAYAAKHVAKGEETLAHPLPEIAGKQVGLGTGFWLSEVGPQFILNLLARDPASGASVELAPCLGDDGQWSVAAAATNLRVLQSLRVKAALELWRQRGAAEPGTKDFGGRATGGVGVTVVKGVELQAEGGYKTRGATLGQPFKPGVSAIGGVAVDLF